MTPPITVYTNVGWGPCHRATEYLSRKGVPFTERNVGKDPTARQELMELGLMSLPVILIGDKRLTGFNPNAIDAALASE
jgi:glutaredoxin